MIQNWPSILVLAQLSYMLCWKEIGKQLFREKEADKIIAHALLEEE